MTLEQQIEEAILSTLVVENKESIKTFCVPKIMAIVEKYGSEMLHEYPPVLGEFPSITSAEIGYLEGIETVMRNAIKDKLDDKA